MNKDQFYTYLKEGVQGTAEEQEALKEILAKYPYFQSARVLLSKSSYLSGHHEFDQVLQQAAIHVGDRSYLFHEHTKELLAKSIADVEREMDAMEEVEAEERLVDQFEEGSEAEVASDLLQEEESSESKSESDAEKDRLEHHQEEEKEDEEVLVDERSVSREDKRKFDEMDELGQAVLLGALNSSIEQEVSVQNETNEAEEKLSGVEAASVGRLDEEETAEELSAFASWVYKRAIGMNYGDGLTEVKSRSEAEQQGQGEESFPQLKLESSDPMSKAEMIDRFIQNEPKITPRRAMDVEAPEVVAKALVQDEEWVTETLAQVYAKQGNLGKARKAYKLLALKYPEKSVYFANQIKKLGNQSNK